mmetsp:Transcript_11076/g.25365  ORF Transcript_11076/g.25365 Transcript_11076/m.25365 type:complete len:210 (-) Transcript_11076:352-981(-)
MHRVLHCIRESGFQVCIAGVPGHIWPPAILASLLVMICALLFTWHPSQLHSITKHMCVHSHVRMPDIKQVDDRCSLLADARESLQFLMHLHFRQLPQVLQGCSASLLMQRVENELDVLGFGVCQPSTSYSCSNLIRRGKANLVPSFELLLQQRECSMRVRVGGVLGEYRADHCVQDGPTGLLLLGGWPAFAKDLGKCRVEFQNLSWSWS